MGQNIQERIKHNFLETAFKTFEVILWYGLPKQAISLQFF